MHEDEIITLLKQREQKGLADFVKHYGPLMRYIISPILPDMQDQEECLSEVILRVWDKIALYDPERGSWNSWLTALTRNTALNRARKNRQLGTPGQFTEDMPSPEPTPEETILDRERQEALRRILQQLSTKDRVLFYRKYYYLQSVAQIAAETGMTERAVEGRLYRLRKRIRKQLGGEEDDA